MQNLLNLHVLLGVLELTTRCAPAVMGGPARGRTGGGKEVLTTAAVAVGVGVGMVVMLSDAGGCSGGRFASRHPSEQADQPIPQRLWPERGCGQRGPERNQKQQGQIQASAGNRS